MTADRSQRAANNVFISIATQLLVWALTFTVTLFLPRYVGSAGLGEMATAGSFVGLFGIFITLGSSTVLVKQIALDRTKTSELLATGLALRIPFSFLIVLVTVAVSNAVGYSSLIRTLIVISSVTMVLGSVNDALSSLLIGQENMARQGVAAVAEKLIYAVSTILLIFLHASLPALVCTGVLSTTIALLINLSAFRAFLPHLRFPRRSAVFRLATAGLPFLGWSVFQTLYGQTDPLILSFTASNVAVGWYAAAFRLTGATMFFPSAIAAALMPALTALHGEDNQLEFRSMARLLLSICVMLAVPITLVFLFLPDRLLALLHYPRSFNGSIPVLRVAGIGCLLYFVAVAVGTTVVAVDRQGAMLRASIIATVVGIPACVVGSWLTGHFGVRCFGGPNAAVGAMASDVALEAILVVLYLRALPRDIFGPKSASHAARVLAAATPMGLVLVLPAGQHLGLWIVMPAVAVYIGACFLFGCVDSSYLSALHQMIRRRF